MTSRYFEALKNKDFRRVLDTGKRMQLVAMRLRPGEDVGAEVHPSTDQLFIVVKGRGEAEVGRKRFQIVDGDAFLVPAGTRHDVVATTDLRLLTAYAPPAHPRGRVQRTRSET